MLKHKQCRKLLPMQTYSMFRCTPFFSIQEISRVLWTPKSYHCTKKHVPILPIPTENNPAYTISIYFFKIYFNISHSSKPRTSKWRIYFTFPHQKSLCITRIRSACPSHLILLYLITHLTSCEDYKTEWHHIKVFTH